VFVPAGTYEISAPLVVKAGYNGITLQGVGSSKITDVGGTSAAGVSTIISAPGANLAELLLIGDTNWVSGVTVRDLQFNPGSGTTGHGIVARIHYSTIEHVGVMNPPQDCIRLETPFGQTNVNLIKDCYLHHPGRDCLFLDTVMTDVMVTNVFLTPYGSRYGIYNRGSGNQFIGCHSYLAYTGAAFFQDSGQNTTIIGGLYETAGTSGYGIYVNGACDTFKVVGATLFDNGLGQIVVTGGASRVSVIGCDFYSLNPTFVPAIAYAIHFTDVSMGSIADNTVKGAAHSHGIRIDGASDRINVHDNSVRDVSDGLGIVVAGSTQGLAIHDNTMNSMGIQETGTADYNLIHDNVMFAGTLTLVGTHSVIRNNIGFNPVGTNSPISQPAVPASTTVYTNAFGVDAMVHVTGGTVSAIAIGATATGLTSGSFRVPAGQTIKLTYTVAPTWKWFGD
jgi:hypothetical protein